MKTRRALTIYGRVGVFLMGKPTEMIENEIRALVR
jgi:hypothetical protein